MPVEADAEAARIIVPLAAAGVCAGFAVDAGLEPLGVDGVGQMVLAGGR
jgi:hypothetical protein